ncbi:uncharacterized protein JN550_009142 [Neoarthrinium moseri]|uniref:uncharacterized protein n=1 Tax=Neoarthrinium moseri TaxID=1658444 RepID=UPI001FDCDA91|nr:uncharacterized protein JN550_009142 [Neoarthrinium moseri]KAI1864122.1 hypothetical protein JN550_009142 [Neoarthrinium moseri]
MPSFGAATTATEVVQALPQHVKGRTFLITGTGEKGIGAAAAVALAHGEPEQLILVSRSKTRVYSVVEDIASVNPNIKVVFQPCDLSDFDSVKQTASTILNSTSIPRIDVVVNNAGVMAIMEYTKDKQGYEMTLSACHLGHFLLTNLIMPKIIAAGPGSRIVNVTSNGHRVSPFRFHDWNFSDGKEYEIWTAYGQAKTANILYTVELARRLASKNIQSYAVHPGGVTNTNLSSHADYEIFNTISEVAKRNNGWDSFPPLDPNTFKTSHQGAAPLLTGALDPALDEHSGAYIVDCHIEEALDYATDPRNAKKLWDLSEELVGHKFDF